jgi:hypothetical protein
MAVGFSDGRLERYNLQTMQSLGPSMQLFPKGISLQPKQLRIHSNDTFAVVFKTGTVVLCRRSLKGEMAIIAKLYQSNEALQLNDPNVKGIDLTHQQIEFLESESPTIIRTLLLSKPEQIDLVTIKIYQDEV